MAFLLTLLLAAGSFPLGDDVDLWALEATPLDRTAAEMVASTRDHLLVAEEIFEQLTSEAGGEHTVENTLQPYNTLLMHVDAAGSENGLFARVHPDADVREIAEKGQQEISAFITRLSQSPELYAALSGIDVSEADVSTGFFLEKELEDFRRSGVDKSPVVRERLAALRGEIVSLGQEFQRNLSEDVRFITLPPEDLRGMPDDWLASHPPDKETGLVQVDTSYPDYVPFVTYAESPEGRSALYREYKDRGYPANKPVLRSIIEKRHEFATLLGYGDWAAFATADKMIGSSEAAQEFIDQIALASGPSAERDYKTLLRRKQKDEPWAKSIADWEKPYYGQLVRKSRFSLDPKEVRPYFNFESVRQGLFDLTSAMFGIRYEPVDGLDLWHESVTAWDIFEGDRQLGRFYLDLHPRPDKYGHAACFGYRDGVRGQRLPQASLVCNFADPARSEEGVALMEFGEVKTFFHEFGHLLHGIFAGDRDWIGNSGIATERDFVEAPSQMLEEWCYDPGALRLFARHYQTGEPIPPELIAKLRASEDFGKGSNAAHQMFYAALSLSYYATDPEFLDLDRLAVELQNRYSSFAYVEGTHFQYNFGHLYGYSAIYYTYMWSQVIAKDMFSRFEEEGVMNMETALAYRRAVLDPGGSRPASELVEEFLGRPARFDAFARWLDR